MSDDDGLARIDAMLNDYIPPSHLALVATPEEAELLGHDPEGYEWGSYPTQIIGTMPRPVTQNTYALATGRAAHVDRSRQVEMGLMYILNHEIERRFGSPVTATIYRTDQMMTTYVDASNGDIEVRYVMEDDYRFDILTFRPSRITQRGSVLHVPAQIHAFEYFVYQPRPAFEPMRPMEFLVEVVPERRTLDLTPIRISMEVARQLRGRALQLQVLDEVAAFTEGMRQVGVAGREASELLNQFRDQLLEEIPEQEDTRPSPPAPLVRSHLDGQRSPYGPPSRRRTR